MRHSVVWLLGILGLALSPACQSGGDGGNPNFGTNSDPTGTNTETDNPGTGTDDGTGTGTGEDTGTGTGPVIDTDECASVPWNIEINPINMLVVLDRSRSMELSQVEPDSDAADTFAAVTATALKAVVSTYDANDLVNFGLAVFPSLDCPKGEDDPDTDVQCKPASTADSPLVEIAADNSNAIVTALDSVGTCGGTPISASLTWANAYIQTLPAHLKAQDTYVLLATDGAPNCNANNHKDVSVCDCTTTKTPQGFCPSKILCLDDSATYNAAVQLKQKGVKVFVIGVGNQLAEWDEVMNNIADYGGTSAYYPASNPATLGDALETITGEAVECTFDVNWSSVPDVDGNGTPVVKACNKVRVYGIDKDDAKKDINYSFNCEDPEGWQWQGLDTEMNPDANDTTPLTECGVIELCPDACKALKQASFKTITAGFGCGLIVPK